jgi:hypothetical protein
MSNTSYQKDFDYKVDVADGIVFQIKDAECKLIFYQEELNPNDQGNEFETEKRNIKLKLEIRLPELVLQNLVSLYNDYKRLSDFGINTAAVAPRDRSVMSKWTNYHNNLGQLVIDTHNLFPYDKFKNMTDLSEDLWLKAFSVINKKSNTNNNQEEINDGQK